MVLPRLVVANRFTAIVTLSVDPRAALAVTLRDAPAGAANWALTAAAVANAIYNATGVRVRDYPITLDKLIEHLPEVA